ncbi:Plasmodesmata-located protein 8 [Sarracenia purpurea var. burkii]
MMRKLHQHSTLTTLSPPRSLTLLLLSFFFFLLSSLNFSHARRLTAANIFIYAGCSQEKYQPNSPFETNLNSLLSSVVSSASQASYTAFAIGNGSSASAAPPESAVFGLYQCRGDLNLPDCSKCVEAAVSQISLVCPYTYGASLQLDACLLRIEHVDFLGKLDTSLRYKKCSKSSSNDVEFFRRRDDVLGDLAAAAAGFRVSSSGLVEGFAQCLGDMSSGDCSACLTDAVGKLKSLCGSTEAADVFLGQCYARYWASGYYDTTSG